MNNDPQWMKNIDDFIWFNPKWNNEQKEQYFLEKRNKKLEIYIGLLVVISCLLGGMFIDFLIGIALLALVALGGAIIQFRRTYSSFRDTEED
tara:strand:- start:72 stop:347 length:276 start_codon:yes stop_codon:yes gene_type:complete